MHRAIVLLFILSAVIPVSRVSRAADETPPAAGQDDARRAIALVQMLGNEEFATRERATTQLIEMGLPARSALEQGKLHADREIRYRCARILTIIDELDFQRRLAAFAAGRDDEHGLPGWDRYRETFGGSAEARAMFVEMQKAEPDVMHAVEDGPQGVGKAIEIRCTQVQQIQRVARQPVSLGTVAAMLFAVSDQKVDLNFEAASALGSFCYQTELQNAMMDTEKRTILRRLLGDWIKRGDGWTAYQSLSLAMRYELKEGLVPAQKVLENPGNQPYIRQNGILAIAKLGDQSHTPLLESLLEDESRCASQRIKDKTYETQIRDVALAALVIMARKEPSDFGFDRLQKNEMSVFVTSTVGFESDEKRKEAVQKWQEYRAAGKSPDDNGASPAENKPNE